MNLYDATVPVFTKLLSNVEKWIDKAAAHADAKKFDVDVLASARLAPEQYAFVRQIQAACDQATYTAADANVVPPVAVYPKLPTLRPSDRNVSAFEIVVTPAGTVESVKAAEEPESLARAMQMTGILSAAKSWRFQPASRNGHAVRYRLVVLLELH